MEDRRMEDRRMEGGSGVFFLEDEVGWRIGGRVSKACPPEGW